MEEQNATQNYEQNTADKPNLSVVVNQESRLKEQKARKEENRPNSHQGKPNSSGWHFWLPHIIQSALAVIACGTLIIIYFQLVALRDQTGLISTQTATLKKQTDILNSQTAILQSQLVNDHRPWISFKEAARTVTKEGIPLSIGLTFMNTGNSPALDLTIKAAVEIRDKPLPTPLPAIRKKATHSRGVIGPQATCLHPIDITNVTEKHLANLQSGAELLYIWGHVNYKDIFGKQHQTTFCMHTEPGSPNYVACGNNNYAD